MSDKSKSAVGILIGFSNEEVDRRARMADGKFMGFSIAL